MKVGMVVSMKQMQDRIAARDKTIARLEADLKDKRGALAREITAHGKTMASLKDAQAAIAELREWGRV